MQRGCCRERPLCPIPRRAIKKARELIPAANHCRRLGRIASGRKTSPNVRFDAKYPSIRGKNRVR
jgi:hypothetical protein